MPGSKGFGTYPKRMKPQKVYPGNWIRLPLKNNIFLNFSRNISSPKKHNIRTFSLLRSALNGAFRKEKNRHLYERVRFWNKIEWTKCSFQAIR